MYLITYLLAYLTQRNKNTEHFMSLRGILAPGPCESSLRRCNFSVCAARAGTLLKF